MKSLNFTHFVVLALKSSGLLTLDCCLSIYSSRPSRGPTARPNCPLLLYRVQILLESASHAGDQVNVVVHTAAHAAVHERMNSWLLCTGVKKILRLIVAVHRASRQTILRTRRRVSTSESQEEFSLKTSHDNLMLLVLNTREKLRCRFSSMTQH